MLRLWRELVKHVRFAQPGRVTPRTDKLSRSMLTR